MRKPESELKAQLQSIAEQDFQPNHKTDLFSLAEEMLDWIGSPDPQLRDDLIYRSFYHWIIRQGRFSADELRQLLDTALDDNHLYAGLGELYGDLVFRRSFSALLAALLLGAHRQKAYLPKEKLQYSLNRLATYMETERDHRGYAGEKGWAHAVAHASDAIDELARMDEVDADSLRRILQAIARAAAVSDTPYVHLEDERLSYAAIGVLEREALPVEEIQSWLLGFIEPGKNELPFPQRHYLHLNVRNFVRSLYFRLMNTGLPEEIRQACLDVLEGMRLF